MSELSSRKKIFYGTLDFDFYETQSDKKVLNSIFEKLNTIKLFNFYQGMPVTQNAEILKFAHDEITLKISKQKYLFTIMKNLHL